MQNNEPQNVYVCSQEFSMFHVAWDGMYLNANEIIH
jgi:hypothetical protein